MRIPRFEKAVRFRTFNRTVQAILFVGACLMAYFLSWWRLPTIEELSSLVDNSNSEPSLPSDHPFNNIQSGRYWTTTTVAWLTTQAWYVDFTNGSAGSEDKDPTTYCHWCVRGGYGPDAY